MSKIFTLGDSVTVGTGASGSAAYANRLANELGYARVNTAVGGDQAADQSIRSQSIALTPGDVGTLMVGINDHKQYKANSGKQLHFAAFLRRCIGNMIQPARVSARTAAKTGTWSNSDSATGIFSTTAGSKVSAVVSGQFISIGYILHAYGACVGSLANVYIDGTFAGDYTCDGLTDPMNTLNGATWGGALKSFNAGSPGPHTVEVVVGAGGKRIYVDDIRGSDQPAVKAVVGNVIEMSAAAYAGNGTSAANVAALNNLIYWTVEDFKMQGYNVLLADTHAALNDNSDLNSDGVHPNDVGHGKLFNAFKQALSGPYSVDYPTVSGLTLHINFTAEGKASSWSEV